MHLLLIDDHPLFGAGFAHALEVVRPTVRVRTAPTLDAGLKLAAADDRLDIALIDYRLAGENGLAALASFGRRFPLVARVLITGEDVRHLVCQARAAGAVGCLGKQHSAEAILAALERVLDGGECFDEPDGARAPAVPAASATPRQMEVLALIAKGRLNKQIADQLGIAERTVKLHITALLQAFDARNRTHLLVKAREHGLL
ncbi:response regulator transcription factor [Roseateles sp.]|uniref:response regulator transcription factor n=1 Tax=Roseateles sp. TaxID=1971397 RepID=UPI002E077482|nr:response regulator transcription factor [Roseateles sp.]